MWFALDQNPPGWKHVQLEGLPGLRRERRTKMAAGETDPHGDGTMGSTPSQGIFIGGMAIGLLAFMGLFTLFVLIAAVMQPGA